MSATEEASWPDGAQAKCAEDDAAIATALQRLTSGVCPECGAAVERERQVGRCVYAEPCNHRLYQGRTGAFRQEPSR